MEKINLYQLIYSTHGDDVYEDVLRDGEILHLNNLAEAILRSIQILESPDSDSGDSDSDSDTIIPE